MQTKRSVRVAVVGTGNIGVAHARDAMAAKPRFYGQTLALLLLAEGSTV